MGEVFDGGVGNFLRGTCSCGGACVGRGTSAGGERARGLRSCGLWIVPFLARGRRRREGQSGLVIVARRAAVTQAVRVKAARDFLAPSRFESDGRIGIRFRRGGCSGCARGLGFQAGRSVLRVTCGRTTGSSFENLVFCDKRRVTEGAILGAL